MKRKINKWLFLIPSLLYHFPILYFSVVKSDQSLEVAAEMLKAPDWYYFSLIHNLIIPISLDCDFIYVVVPSILIYMFIFYFLFKGVNSLILKVFAKLAK